MKNNTMTSVLVCALLVSALVTAGLVFGWDYYRNRIIALQPRMVDINNIEATMGHLFADCSEYAKTSPSGSKDMMAVLTSAPSHPPTK